MASHSLPIPLPHTRERTETGITNRGLSVRTAIAIFAVLFLLFGWLHLFLALEITATNREIQNKMTELQKHKRDMAAILIEIAEAESPQEMELRVLNAGFRRQELVYLLLGQSSVLGTSEGAGRTTPSPKADEAIQASLSQSQSPLDTVFDELIAWLEAETGP